MTDVQTLTETHRSGLRDFFAAVPEGDRTFFRDRVLDDGTIDAWLAEQDAQRLVAVDGQAVVGVASLVPGAAWSAHVGNLEVVVSPARRRHGIGRMLVQQSVLRGVGHGIEKFVVQALAEDDSTLALFQGLGFVPEALLTSHVRDSSGEDQDLLLLAHVVEDNAAAFAATGVADAFGGYSPSQIVEPSA